MEELQQIQQHGHKTRRFPYCFELPCSPGKRFVDSGIRDLLIESDIYGSNLVPVLLHGKSSNRGV